MRFNSVESLESLLLGLFNAGWKEVSCKAFFFLIQRIWLIVIKRNRTTEWTHENDDVIGMVQCQCKFWTGDLFGSGKGCAFFIVFGLQISNLNADLFSSVLQMLTTELTVNALASNKWWVMSARVGRMTFSGLFREMCVSYQRHLHWALRWRLALSRRVKDESTLD